MMCLRSLFLIIFIISCSFKPNQDDKSERRMHQGVNGSPIVDLDVDGDGIEDKDDPEPFIADVPVIGGEFFKNLDIKFLYRGEFKSLNILRDHEGMGSFVQMVSESQTNMGDHIRSRLSPEHINIFTFKNLKNSHLGKIEEYYNVVDRVSVEIDSEFLMSYREGSFNNLKIELYFYNRSKRELEQISSVILGENLNFNQLFKKKLLFPISYSNPERVVNDRGRNLFLKVSDFSIASNGQSYSRLMNSVLAKTFPVVVSNGESIKSQYIATRNRRLTAKEALTLAKMDFKESNGTVFQIDTIKNDSSVGIDFFGNTVKDEKRWLVVTRNISTNHQAYSFGVGDFLFYSYVSQLNPKVLRPRLIGDVGASRKKTIHSAIVNKENFDRSRIVFRPISFRGVITQVDRFKDCKWDDCFKFSSRVHHGNSLDAMSSLYFVEVTLNNENFNLGKLHTDGQISLKKIDGKDLFEIVLGPEFRSLIKKENAFGLSFIDHKGLYCDGTSYCSGVYCENFFSSISPSCDLSNFYKDHIFYETQLVRNFSIWDGSAYIGYEFFE